MLKLVILVLSLTSVFCNTQAGVNWAVLVAGSNGYYNYRHQADVCHAYQIIHKHGIPDERIIVMMYDDIASDPENPTPGKIINKPSGDNVYTGVPHDYTGETVTAKNFLHVLHGNASALQGVGSGKVLRSGPNDNVFIFFSDHGAPGLVAFPSGDVLHAADLHNTLLYMHTHKKYKNMVIYVEACESGSMFENLLPNNIHIYATTASNGEESSYACYYDETYQTYLGDVYSVMWMEDSDSEDLTRETLQAQFSIVQKETTTSHVMQFGDVAFSKAHNVSEFQGNKKTEASNLKVNYEEILKDAVPSEEVRVSILKKKISKEKNPTKRIQLAQELKQVTQEYTTARNLILKLATNVLSNKNLMSVKELKNKRLQLVNHECYKKTVDHMLSKCFDSRNDYFLRSLYMIVNLCELGVSADELAASVNTICYSN